MLRAILPLLIAAVVPLAILTIIITGTALSLIAWQPPILQTTQFGTKDSENGITALSSDSTGIYVAGFVGYSNVTPTYLFVTKYDPNLRQIWTRAFGDPSRSQILGMGVSAEGVYVAGGPSTSPMNESSFVRKYDFNGNQIWNKEIVSGGSYATISVTAMGLYLVGNNGTRYSVTNYDPNGNLLWSGQLGNYTGRVGVYADSGGVYNVGIRTLGTTTQTGTSLVQKRYSNGTLAWTDVCSCWSTYITGDSSGIYTLGTVATAGAAEEGFIGKYDVNGKQLWTAQFSAPGFSGVATIEGSSDSSGVYLATTTSNDKGVVLKYDANGNPLWSVQLPWTTTTHQLTSEYSISTTSEVIYIGGELEGYSLYPAFLAVVDKSSSLVFFGIDPPFSFGVVGLLGAFTAVSILWFRRRLKKRYRPPSTAARYPSRGIPKDILGRQMQRPTL